ncbi:MAG: HPr kinase/phosphatase C-terminal domain-containing protein [Porphyrobacter sp.]|jgi:serine kinase of HPr protein (carbohydrate metabolism regulator)|nr:HPr kinase/phosphatase C-terminal domain-containing protein [Porphyrobacter sp.]
MSAPAASVIMQASAVVIGGQALLIEGPPGSGKSSLALALLDRGAELIGDDAVTLTRTGERIIASPPPRIAGLIELRGIGLVTWPVAQPAPLALILAIGGPPGERLPQQASRQTVLGVPVPRLAFDPGTVAPAQRAEWALKIHGLATFCN